MPPGFHALNAAQFVSGLADNALLIVTIALLQHQGWAPAWAPALKFCFMAAYVVLAPWLGLWADRFPKARWMSAMNALKALAVLGLSLDFNPLACFALAGVGAAAYAPAKYGLMTELVPPALLVRANGWMEVTLVGAVLLGTALGGALAGHALPWALPALLVLYALAALLNLGIPDSGARYPRSKANVFVHFWASQRVLWKDREGRLSMAATAVFWGAGATLQMAVLLWAEQTLGLPVHQAAYLQALVAVGVVVGASLAGRWIGLNEALGVLPLGVVMGVVLGLAAWVSGLAASVALMVLIGALGGFMLIPLNALLQHRGKTLLSAGQSIAIQAFNENASVLLMLAVYTAILGSSGMPAQWLMSGLGLCVSLAMAAVWALHGQSRAQSRQPRTVSPGAGPQGPAA
jgi:LPLT family lysophospholipid transporter-like MFS transporter